jgi:hypothetical protein
VLRRVLRYPAVWILLPLALAGLYAAAYPFFAPVPTAATVVPKDAILTQRFRDVAAVDRAFLRSPEDPRPASEVVATSRNIPDWVGVDRHRPLFLVLLPRGNRPDASMLIVPLADKGAIRARFDDPSFFLEHKQIRQPMHLGVRGDWGAIAWDEDAVGTLGGDGLRPEDLGATWAVAANVPALVDFALAAPREAPWAGILRALGFTPEPPDAQPRGEAAADAPRVLRIRESWGTARLWSFFDDARVRSDLEVRDPALRETLRALTKAAAADTAPLPAPPEDAEAWLRVPSGLARAALVRALAAAGVPFPEGAAVAGAPLASGDGPGLLAWASPAPDDPAFWTLGVAGPEGALAPLAALLDEDDPAGALLRAEPASDAPFPPVLVSREPFEGLQVLYVGPDVTRAAARFARRQRTKPPWEAPQLRGHRLVAAFGLSEKRARDLLGSVVLPGGLLAPLQGGRIEGAIFTDGTTLRLEAHVVSGP